MNYKVSHNTLYSLATGAVLFFCLAGSPAVAQILFEDGFESGDLTHSENGFVWHSQSSNKVAVVRDDGYVVSGDSQRGPFPDRKFESAPETNGAHALSFYYDAGVAMREKRFTLGGAYPEIWIRFWMRVPINFYKEGRNNKFWRLWMDDYSGIDNKVGSEYRNTTPEGSANVYLKAMPRFNDTAHYKEFIRFPEDLGRWMQVVIHVKSNSAVDSADSVVEQWRRWENEESWTLMNAGYSYNIQPVGVKGSRGFTHGYILGWANGAFSEDTEFLVDEFSISTTRFSDGPRSAAIAPRPPDPVQVD